MLLCVDSVVVLLGTCLLMVKKIYMCVLIVTDGQTNLTADNRAKAGKVGGISAVIKVLNTHTCNANVCQCGCAALWNMTISSGKI